MEIILPSLVIWMKKKKKGQSVTMHVLVDSQSWKVIDDLLFLSILHIGSVEFDGFHTLLPFSSNQTFCFLPSILLPLFPQTNQVCHRGIIEVIIQVL